MGRKPSFINGPRPIDIDILFYGDRVVNVPHLVIRIRACRRGFCAGASGGDRPNLVHPVSGQTVAQMVGQLKSLKGVRKWVRRPGMYEISVEQEFEPPII